MADEAIPERLAGLVAMSSGDTRLDTLIRLTCGRALSLPPLPSEVDLLDGKSGSEAVVVAFAEQFTVDVAGIGKHQRAQFVSTLGKDAFRVTVATFIADFVPRVWAGLEALGMGKPGNGGIPDWDHDADPIGALLNDFAPAVARLQALDPVTTEVVRLRGAAQHNCRLCKSRREGNALDAGGSESLYGDIENFETSEQLSTRQKAALRYVDALIWTPSRISRSVVAGVREHFTEEEAFELTLDVMRNACNKIMVALGADAAQVAEGTELFRVDADGQTVVG
ncbi:alkylhydroperoxidase family enzyme [Mycobacterium sp. OAS707]|uniref:carboxymuconolactone decarboxylase family protein n=1 Tax=Mycobacterium sp. OAS707 TaxID=2663822 RepID=UPI00178A26F5|nr:alkylhydroperoxidase family enzyme [Mycobacterium sp. OAS707]